MFVLTTATILDNLKRSDYRARCRTVASTAEGYVALTQGASDVSAAAWEAAMSTLGFHPENCGWTGLMVRRFNESLVPVEYYQPGFPYGLTLSMGSCQEYSAFFDGQIPAWGNKNIGRTEVPYEPNQVEWAPADGSPPFLIDTPSSIYCFLDNEKTWGRTIASQWLRLIALLVFLAWLVRLRYLSQTMAREADEMIFSTADYAVMLTGLDEKLDANELQTRLRGDIEKLNLDGEGLQRSLGCEWVPLGARWVRTNPPASGERWMEVDKRPTRGRETLNIELSKAVSNGKLHFSQLELNAMGLSAEQVVHDSFVQAGSSPNERFFKPAIMVPPGAEIVSVGLAAALEAGCCHFSAAELAAHGVDVEGVRPHHYVRTSKRHDAAMFVDQADAGVSTFRFFRPDTHTTPMYHEGLSAAFSQGQLTFTPEELREMGVGEVSMRSVVSASVDGKERFFAPRGFFTEGVHHLEVGRHCEDELQVFNTLRRLDTEAEELDARRRARREQGKLPKTEKRALERLAIALREEQTRLQHLWDLPDKATGHAFVVFRLEADRNRFVKALSHLTLPISLHGYLQMLRAKGDKKALKAHRAVPPAAAPDDRVQSIEGPCSSHPVQFSCVSKTAKPVRRTSQFGLMQTIWLRLLLCTYGVTQESLIERGGALGVAAAPEPDEIKWDNLQYPESFVRAQELRGELLVIAAVGAGAVAIVVMKGIQVDLLLKHQLDYSPVSEDSAVGLDVPGLAKIYAMTAAVSLTTVAFDLIVTALCTRYVKYERHATATEEHESLFSKLSWAYLLNAVVVPIGLGMTLSHEHGRFLDQTWYEPGGVIQQASLLIIFGWCTPLAKIFNSMIILRRYIFGRFAYSQQKLNELYEPCQYDIGIQCAYTVKTTALGLAYGPLYPPAYLLTAIGMLISYFCTRFGMRWWYARPHEINQEMMMRMRRRLGNVCAFTVALQALATMRNLGHGGFSAVGVIVIGAPLAVVVYAIVPLGFLKHFARYSQIDNSDEGSAADTGDVAFDEVQTQKGWVTPHYVCPLLQKHGHQIEVVLMRFTSQNSGIAVTTPGLQAELILRRVGLYLPVIADGPQANARRSTRDERDEQRAQLVACSELEAFGTGVVEMQYEQLVASVGVAAESVALVISAGAASARQSFTENVFGVATTSHAAESRALPYGTEIVIEA